MRMWDGGSITGQVLVSTQEFRDVLAAPQLRWLRKGGHFIPVAPTCTAIGEHMTMNLQQT